jgi:hypothetical protein
VKRVPVTAVVAAVCTLLCIALTWPLVLNLNDMTLVTPFAGNMIWDLQTSSDALWNGESVLRTRMAGWPYERNARFLGLSNHLVMWALKPLGAVVVGNLLLMFSPVATAVCMERLLKHWTPDGDPWARGLAALTFALSPHFICNLGNGEMAKAQFWLVPLFVWMAERTVKDWRWLPVAAGVALLAAFTSPYNTMVAALAFGVAGLVLRDKPLRRGAVVVVLIGAVGLSALHYSQPLGVEASDYLFGPSQRRSMVVMERIQTYPLGMATLKSLVWPDPTLPPGGTQHGVYLTWAVLAAAGWSLRKAAQPSGANNALRWVGVGMVVVGVGLALGPRLLITPEWQTQIPTPLWLAEKLDLSVARSGQYYRFLQVALVGLAVLVSRARLHPGAAVALGLVFCAEVSVNTGKGVPLPIADLPHREISEQMRLDPVPGAVLHLPAQPPGEVTRERVFRMALLHRRPVWNLPRGPRIPWEGPPCGGALDKCLAHEMPCGIPNDFDERLERWGVRYVVVHTDHGWNMDKVAASLSEVLGEPQEAEGILLWTLDPVALELVSKHEPPRCPGYTPPETPLGDGIKPGPDGTLPNRGGDGIHRDGPDKPPPPRDGKRGKGGKAGKGKRPPPGERPDLVPR